MKDRIRARGTLRIGRLRFIDASLLVAAWMMTLLPVAAQQGPIEIRQDRTMSIFILSGCGVVYLVNPPGSTGEPQVAGQRRPRDSTKAGSIMELHQRRVWLMETVRLQRAAGPSKTPIPRYPTGIK